MANRNTCGYSYDWQPYKMDYDKFEYDIKLHTGEVIEGCYPNAGFFSRCEEKSNKKIHESQIAMIRFTHNPTWHILKPIIKPSGRIGEPGNNMNKQPKIGRTVIYKTTEAERQAMEASNNMNSQNELPATIVAVWSETTVNLKVELDGEGSLWKTSAQIGNDPGNWNWPQIEGEKQPAGLEVTGDQSSEQKGE